MDVVDSQVHLGPGGVGEALAAMDALGVASVLIDEFWGRRPYGASDFFEPGFALPNGAWRSAYPTAETASIEHPDRFSTVLRVDRRDPALGAVIGFAALSPQVRALRVLPTWNAEEAQTFASGGYDELFGLVQDARLPLFVHLPGVVELLPRYLETHPRLQVVVDHLGMPHPGLPVNRLDGTAIESAEYFEVVLRLADHDNVALKWSHEQNAFEPDVFPFAKSRPFLRRAIDAFGAERLLWASDKSVLPYNWSEILFAVRENPELSDSEKAWLLGGTSRRLLDWSATAGAV